MGMANFLTGILSRPDPELVALATELTDVAHKLRKIEDYAGACPFDSMIAFYALLTPLFEKDIMKVARKLEDSKKALFQKVQFPLQALQKDLGRLAPGTCFNRSAVNGVPTDFTILVGNETSLGPAVRSIHYWKHYPADREQAWNGVEIKDLDPLPIIKRMASTFVKDNAEFIRKRIESVPKMI